MVKAGHDVRILCRASSKTDALDGLHVERVAGDITDNKIVGQAVDDRQWVVHAAADISYWGPNETRQRAVNVEGTRHIASACRTQGVQRLVHVSSVAAIGIPTDPNRPANEEFAFNLEHSGLAYHVSKWQAEQEVAAQVQRGLSATVVNPASVFGPYGAGYRGGDMMRKVLRGHCIVPYFTGGICAVHVQDVVAGIMVALERGQTGQRYILGGENLTYRALAERAAVRMHLRRRFVPLPPAVTGLAAMILEPIGRLRHRRPQVTFATHYLANRFHFYDSGKARTALGYQPRDFDSILDEYVRTDRG
jgi:dihydroflavonol-4-reductase